LRLCIFCLQLDTQSTPWCPSNPGKGCTYGLGHEYVGDDVVASPPSPKVDKKLCTKCGRHPKNPAASTNGCEHEYAT
jgi:hypothetical protein